jgi:hypothetical protein
MYAHHFLNQHYRAYKGSIAQMLPAMKLFALPENSPAIPNVLPGIKSVGRQTSLRERVQ